eukprot:6577256-Heterocapsa_arctica.AAC.1
MDVLLAIYFQGQMAKKRLMGNKGRGKGRSKPVPVKKTGQSRDCQAYGHWSGDPECPKVMDGTVPPFKSKPQPPAHG